MNLEIPGIGTLVEDPDMGWHESAPVVQPLLNGAECNVVLEGYDEADHEGFLRVAAHLLANDFSTLREAEGEIFAYYQDFKPYWQPGDDAYVEIAAPAGVWKHVQFGCTAAISRNWDGHFYVSIECNCDWEPEHGLQIVLRDGLKVNKIGPYDGHVTHSNAYGKEIAEDVIYLRMVR